MVEDKFLSSEVVKKKTFHHFMLLNFAHTVYKPLRMLKIWKLPKARGWGTET